MEMCPAPRRERFTLPPEQQLERILSLKDASAICGLSPDTIKRNFGKFVIHLTPKRYGIKYKHVLEIMKGRD